MVDLGGLLGTLILPGSVSILNFTRMVTNTLCL